MELVSLQISGFKYYDINTQLNFKDEHDNLIFETDGDKKRFLFEAILGVLFGFTAKEKSYFRGDTESVKTFTGMLTLALDERTMIIERDFETDFVACILADPQNVKPIFQGKDYVDSGFERPYLHMLKSIFPIIDKNLYLEIGYEGSQNNRTNLSDLLDTLNLLLTPNFKITTIRKKTLEWAEIIKSKGIAPLEIESVEELLESLEYKKNLIRQTKEIDQSIKMLNRDSDKFIMLSEKIKGRLTSSKSTESMLNEKYPKLINSNPLQLRADILLWKSLTKIEQKNRLEINIIREKKKKILDKIGSDFAEYKKLPASFNKELDQFKELVKNTEMRKKTLAGYRQEIEDIEKEVERKKNNKRLQLILLPPTVFLLSLFIFNFNWVLIIPESLLVILIILLFYGYRNQKLKSLTVSIEEESHIIQKKNHDAERKINELKTKFPVFEDLDNLNAHSLRIKKYNQLLMELKRLQKEEKRMIDIRKSEMHSKKLADYEKKYGHMINIDRPDLESYLDNFVEMKNRQSSIEQIGASYPAIEEIEELNFKYNKLSQDLKKIRTRMIRKLNITNGKIDLDDMFDKVTRKIKNIQLKQELKFTELN